MVARVEENGQAARLGVTVGATVVRINEFRVDGMREEEVVTIFQRVATPKTIHFAMTPQTTSI